MGEIAAKAARKPARGGRANLLLVRARVEELPADLHGVADEVSVQLPWGSLLEGIVLARDDVLGGLAALCRPGARLTVTLNGEIWLDSTPARYESLPVPTPEYVADVVATGLARVGIRFGEARYSSAAEAKALPTTWARRLGHGRAHPSFVRFDGVRVS
jgi:16S rRNA (adenine(1408)-N(1))-methyltransferase